MLMRKNCPIILVAVACISVSSNAAIAQSAATPTIAARGPVATKEAYPNLQDFDFVVEKLRRNYAGWDTKVTNETRPALDQLTARLRSAAQDASPEEFTALLQEWVDFFNDGHVGVTPINTGVPDAGSSSSQSATPSLPWTEVSVRAELDARAAGRDPLEGIWQIDGDLYRIGILPTPNRPGTFSAVVLTTKSESWSPGQIKAELTRKADGIIDVLYRAGCRFPLRFDPGFSSRSDPGCW